MYAIRDSEFIGRRMRQLRERAGLSQSEVGALLEVSYQQVQKYERGINRISVDKLQRLAEALRVPVTAFFADTLPVTSLQEHVEEGQPHYQLAPLSDREVDVLQWFRALPNEEWRACFATLLKLVAQMQQQP
jgi:transcriptional regulator with XRE-family HTH domain